MQSQMSSPMVSNLSCQDLDVDYTDLTVPSGEVSGTSSWILLQDGMGADQRPLVSRIPTSVAAIGGAGSGNQLGSKCFRFLCVYRCWTVRSPGRSGCHNPRRWRPECFRRLFFFFFFLVKWICHITVATNYRGQCYAYPRIQRDLADGVFDD